jgi:hypothetical protein
VSVSHEVYYANEAVKITYTSSINSASVYFIFNRIKINIAALLSN